MLLLVSPDDCPTAHTVNVYRVPGSRFPAVIVFTELVSSTPSPTSRYDVADFAESHVNVRESFVELTNVHGLEIRGAEMINILHTLIEYAIPVTHAFHTAHNTSA